MQCQTMIKPVGIKHSGVVLVMGILNYVHSGLMCVVLFHAIRIIHFHRRAEIYTN